MTDQANFAEDVKPLLGDLKRICWRFEKTPQAVDDLMQDVLYKAYKSYYQFEPGTNLIGWLGRIAYTTYVNKWRRDKRTPDEVGLIPPQAESDGSYGYDRPDTVSPPVEATALEGSGVQREDILRAVKAANPNHQVMMMLVDIDDHSYEETARILDVPIGSVMPGLSRGRLAMRRELRRIFKKAA